MPAGILQALLGVLRALPYAQRLALWAAAALASGLLLYAGRDSARPGWARLWLALPLLAVNFTIPLLFDGDADLTTNISAFIVTTALSTFKVLGWVLNRGPLVQPLTRAQFVAIYVLPITPREGAAKAAAQPSEAAAATAAGKNGNKGGDSQAKDGDSQSKGGRRRGGKMHESGGTPLQRLRDFLLKAAVGLTVGFLLINYDAGIPRVVKTFLYGVGLYCALGSTMDLWAAVIGALLGLPIAPHFQNPYGATSFSDFWNRWNLTVGNALRFLFYDPINEARLVRDPQSAPALRPWRRIAGLHASFFMSGVMHELLIWYFSGKLLGLQQAYFTLWAPVIVVEGAMRRALRKSGIQVPTPVAWLATMLIFHVAGDRLFWEPHIRLGTADHNLATLARLLPWLKLKRA